MIIIWVLLGKATVCVTVEKLNYVFCESSLSLSPRLIWLLRIFSVFVVLLWYTHVSSSILFFTWYPWSYFIMMCSSLSLHTLSLLFGDFLWKALLYIYFRYVYIVHPSPCLDVVSFFLRSSQKVNTYCIMSICIYTSLTILEVHEIWVN